MEEKRADFSASSFSSSAPPIFSLSKIWEKTIPKTPKRAILSHKTNIENLSITNQIPQKRSFGTEFAEFENTPSKIQKSTEMEPISRIRVFESRKTTQNTLTKAEVAEIVSIELKPLILEIQSLKSEVLSLKKERNTTKPALNSSIHAQKSEKITQQADTKKTENASKSLQNTAKKTFAEIAKMNETLSEQSIKLDKWTLVKSPKKALAKKQLDPVDRRILLKREKSTNSVNIPDLLLAINLAIKKCGLPEFVRITRLWNTPSGAISGQLKEGANAEMLNSAKKEILEATKKIDGSIISIQAAEQWYSLRVHTVSLERYLNSSGMEKLQEEIESSNAINLPYRPRWINQKRAEERFNNKEIRYSTTIIKVRSKSIANSLIAKGIEFGGKKHSIEIFEEIKEDTLCPKCSEYGHSSYKTCQNQAKCMFCAENHETKDHKCQLSGCTSLTGKFCLHTLKKCINCQGPHLANSNFCPKRLEILGKMRKAKKEEFLRLQESRKKIEVIIPKSTYKESSNSESNSETAELLKSILNTEIDSEMDMETASEL